MYNTLADVRDPQKGLSVVAPAWQQKLHLDCDAVSV
jgi:hypothetical protein